MKSAPSPTERSRQSNCYLRNERRRPGRGFLARTALWLSSSEFPRNKAYKSVLAQSRGSCIYLACGRASSPHTDIFVLAELPYHLARSPRLWGRNRRGDTTAVHPHVGIVLRGHDCPCVVHVTCNAKSVGKRNRKSLLSSQPARLMIFNATQGIRSFRCPCRARYHAGSYA
jgi:hypothetical protein